MATVTLTQLIASVRLRADMVGSAFVTDAEVTEYLNTELQQLYDLLISAGAEEYFETSTNFALTSGTVTYSLPTDFLRLVALQKYQTGSTGALDAELQSYEALETSRNDFGGDPNYPRYRIFGGKIDFRPSPSTMTLQMRYIPQFTKLVNPSDTFDGINGYEEYAIWGAVVTCLRKEESDIREAMAQRTRQEKRIEDMKSTRDQYRAHHVVDVNRKPYWSDLDDERLPWPR